MRSSARAVVIGGGIAGASVLYQLVRNGWSDVVLIEQGDLGDGTTWHSAGHCIVPYVSRQMTHFTRESIAIYQGLEAETGRPAGFMEIGSLTLATTTERVDDLRRLEGAARVEDVPYHLISPDEAAAIWPLASLDGVILAGHSPRAGRVDPLSGTAALVAAAVNGGAEVERRTRVVAVDLLASGEWSVKTDRGSIRAEYVVNAAGQWARDLGHLSGIEIPTVPLEHQYILSAPIVELAGVRDLPILRDPDSGFYLRQEGEGLLVGVYEDDVRAWCVDGVPPDFLRKLLPGDIDRIANLIERAGRRVRVLADAGIRTVVNGPDAYTPDDRFVMGPVVGHPTYFVFAGFNSAGVQTSPGAARYLAEWMIEGEPTADLDEYDARRFGPQTRSVRYLTEGAKETYRNHYPVRHPIEERKSGRPSRMSPLHDLLAARGAVFGERFGWERPVWFAPPGESGDDLQSFRRPAWLGAVEAESLAIRDGVGVVDQTSFAKHIVEGPGAAAFLDGLIATALPDVGRIGYAILLGKRGGIALDLTIARLSVDCFYLVGAAAGEVRDRESLIERLPPDGSVRVRTVTTEIGVLTVAGPRSRQLLERVSGTSLASTETPFLSHREIPIGYATVRAMRLSYTGELGWELHLPIEALTPTYLALGDAGHDLGLTDVGYRALDWLGLEMGYGALGSDLTRDYTPIEAGLGHLVKLTKGPFVGRDALIERDATGPAQRRVWLLFDPRSDAQPSGMEPVSLDGSLVGFTVRGGYGSRIGRALAVAYLPPEVIEVGTGLTVAVLGEECPVTLALQPPYRPPRS